jgi:hypothetical protein
VLAEIERERAHAETMTQDTQALAYERSQFRLADMWDTASAPRRKVLAAREKLFGTGRRLPQGVSGAHGRYNRLQWRLDGKSVLVDQLGRTESEAEEEEGLPEAARLDEDEDDVDAVPHPAMRPTWLLRFFHTWRARWSAGKGEEQQQTLKPGVPHAVDDYLPNRKASLTPVQEVDGDESENSIQ